MVRLYLVFACLFSGVIVRAGFQAEYQSYVHPGADIAVQLSRKEEHKNDTKYLFVFIPRDPRNHNNPIYLNPNDQHTEEHVGDLLVSSEAASKGGYLSRITYKKSGTDLFVARFWGTFLIDGDGENGGKPPRWDAHTADNVPFINPSIAYMPTKSSTKITRTGSTARVLQLAPHANEGDTVEWKVSPDEPAKIELAVSDPKFPKNERKPKIVSAPAGEGFGQKYQVSATINGATTAADLYVVNVNAKLLNTPEEKEEADGVRLFVGRRHKLDILLEPSTLPKGHLRLNGDFEQFATLHSAQVGAAPYNKRLRWTKFANLPELFLEAKRAGEFDIVLTYQNPIRDTFSDKVRVSVDNVQHTVEEDYLLGKKGKVTIRGKVVVQAGFSRPTGVAGKLNVSLLKGSRVFKLISDKSVVTEEGIIDWSVDVDTTYDISGRYKIHADWLVDENAPSQFAGRAFYDDKRTLTVAPFTLYAEELDDGGVIGNNVEDPGNAPGHISIASGSQLRLKLLQGDVEGAEVNFSTNGAQPDAGNFSGEVVLSYNQHGDYVIQAGEGTERTHQINVTVRDPKADVGLIVTDSDGRKAVDGILEITPPEIRGESIRCAYPGNTNAQWAVTGIDGGLTGSPVNFTAHFITPAPGVLLYNTTKKKYIIVANTRKRVEVRAYPFKENRLHVSAPDIKLFKGFNDFFKGIDKLTVAPIKIKGAITLKGDVYFQEKYKEVSSSHRVSHEMVFGGRGFVEGILEGKFSASSLIPGAGPAVALCVDAGVFVNGRIRVGLKGEIKHQSFDAATGGPKTSPGLAAYVQGRVQAGGYADILKDLLKVKVGGESTATLEGKPVFEASPTRVSIKPKLTIKPLTIIVEAKFLNGVTMKESLQVFKPIVPEALDGSQSVQIFPM